MKIKDKEIEIRCLKKNELVKFRELISLFHDVFEMENPEAVGDVYLTQLLEKPDFIAFAIMHNGEILGGATAYLLPLYYSRSSELFIYDVAIHAGYQRSGLGAKLISAIKDYCRQNGIGEMFVPAHEEDAHALKFYKATGGKAEKVVHFNYKVRE